MMDSHQDMLQEQAEVSAIHEEQSPPIFQLSLDVLLFIKSSLLDHKCIEFCKEELWVSGFKYRIFLGVGFLRYGHVSSRQPKYFFLSQSCF